MYKKSHVSSQIKILRLQVLYPNVWFIKTLWRKVHACNFASSGKSCKHVTMCDFSIAKFPFLLEDTEMSRVSQVEQSPVAERTAGDLRSKLRRSQCLLRLRQASALSMLTCLCCCCLPTWRWEVSPPPRRRIGRQQQDRFTRVFCVLLTYPRRFRSGEGWPHPPPRHAQ